MNDEMIIELYFARSEDAITETDRKYGECCRTTAFGILGSHEDSEECVDDTYMKLWDTIPPSRPEKLGAFVIRVCRNTALNLLKAKGRLKKGGGYGCIDFEEIAEILPAAETVESTADSNEALRAVEKFVMSLSREKRMMFMRRYFYFRTCAEIAEELGVTEGKVKMTLQRTREKLRRYLEKEGIDI